MAEAGIPLHVLQDILCHASVDTARGYLHPDNHHLASAAEQANAFLAKVSGGANSPRRRGPSKSLSLAQACEKWGENQANAIWDASIVKIVLGGASNSRDLQDLTTLIGDRDETTDSLTTDAYGASSNQRSIRRVPVLPPDVLRTMPFGTGVILLRSARPIITTLRPWPKRADAKVLQADRLQIEDALRDGIQYDPWASALQPHPPRTPPHRRDLAR
jgi:hypothetical protein